MKLSSKQREDLEATQYFIPSNCSFSDVMEDDIERYFAWSDRGIGKNEIEHEARQTNTGLSALYWGKQRRDLQITSYIQDWGKYITAVDFVDEPKAVVSFVSRVIKRPGIMDMWVLFNEPNQLTDESKERFSETMGVLVRHDALR